MPLALLADIGGTNTRVALAEGARVRPETIRRFSNADYAAQGRDIGHILQDYLADCDLRPAGCCVAAAGPVQEGVARMTNLSWVIDDALIARASGADYVAVLNDLQAQGHALGHIAPQYLRPLVKGPTKPQAPMLVVGLGTGVNAAPVHGSGAARHVPPSECGHINLPVRSLEDLAVKDFVEAALAAEGTPAHCGIEEVLSGRGVLTLQRYVAGLQGAPLQADFGAFLQAAGKGDPVCAQTLRLYGHYLAQFLADQALIHLPWGGIYLIGGVARALVPLLPPSFAADFREPRRIDLLTHGFSITLVEDDYAALTGCAAWLDALHQDQQSRR